jgi:putative ABC transport system substrate-binding protein
MRPLAARAQQRAMSLVGIVATQDRRTTLQGIGMKAFSQRLGDLGWTPGRNIAFEYRFADNKPNRLAALVDDLVRLKPDAIYVPTRPALPTVKAATTTIPIVFVSLGDPVSEGWVSSLAKPGGNLTGVAGLSPELAGKRLELLREITPTLAKVAILANPTNRSEETAIQATETAAKALEMSVFVQPVNDADEFDRAISALLRNGAQSIIVQPDPMFNSHRAELVQLIGRSRLPAIYMETGFAAAGGLISYGPSFDEIFRRSADYVDKILRGAKPADLPVEQATRFELILNLKTAKAIGLTMPETLLGRADEVIE